MVADVGAEPITVAMVQAYLDANQFSDPGADPIPPGDLARVKSRLFDDYLDGEILFQEAKKRAITVSDAELADYLDKDQALTPSARELARRDLTIQKLRESVVVSGVKIDEKEVDAWLDAHKPPADAAAQGTLHTLRLASYPEAMRVRSEIVSKRLSFMEAESAYGADSLPAAPGDDDLQALPPQIASAAKALTPGTISQPLPYESSVLLFLMEPPDDPEEINARRRETARRSIALDKSQAIADKLLSDLKAKTKVVRHERELPFAYVAEDAASHTQ